MKFTKPGAQTLADLCTLQHAGGHDALSLIKGKKAISQNQKCNAGTAAAVQRTSRPPESI